MALGGNEGIIPASGATQGPAGIFSRITAIATAAVKTLNATPVSIIPAPGAGLFIEIVSIHAWLVYGTAGYDAVGASDDLAFKYTNASGAKVVTDIEATGFGDATSDQHRVTYPTNGAANMTPVANAAVVAHILTGEWFASAGDSSLKIEATYRIRSLAF